MGRRIAIGIAGLALAAPAAASAADCPNANVLPSRSGAAAARTATLCLVNAERTSHGMRALKFNGRLEKAASSYSREMVAHHFFDHVSPAGTDIVTRLRRVHYITPRISWSIGENIAWGEGSLATPAEIVDAWMNSPGHRANILNGSFREIGIGVASGAPVSLGAAAAGATYATDFGYRG
jgi:uncharacterized protein YkwD